MSLPYTLHRQPSSSLIIDSPHSGRDYPADFNYVCALDDLRRTEDFELDRILAPLASQATLLSATVPRSYIDLNRAADDIDPALCWDFIAAKPSIYTRQGIGLIHRNSRPGVPIYRRRLTAAEIWQRIETCYHPYYDALTQVIDTTRSEHAEVLHVNLHSMPSAVAPVDQRGRAYDLIIGTADGAAKLETGMRLATLARHAGFHAGVNIRFKGGHLVRHFGRPGAGVQSVQFEFNRAIYMDERRLELTAGADRITGFLSQLAEWWCAQSLQAARPAGAGLVQPQISLAAE